MDILKEAKITSTFMRMVNVLAQDKISKMKGKLVYYQTVVFWKKDT